MSFALEEAGLWRHLEGTAVATPPPPPLEVMKDDSEAIWLGTVFGTAFRPIQPHYPPVIYTYIRYQK